MYICMYLHIQSNSVIIIIYGHPDGLEPCYMYIDPRYGLEPMLYWSKGQISRPIDPTSTPVLKRIPKAFENRCCETAGFSWVYKQISLNECISNAGHGFYTWQIRTRHRQRKWRQDLHEGELSIRKFQMCDTLTLSTTLDILIHIYFIPETSVLLPLQREILPTTAFTVRTCWRNSGWPDWANFRLLDDCLLWLVILKIAQIAKKILATFSRGASCVFVLAKHGLGYLHFGRFFHKLIWSHWRNSHSWGPSLPRGFRACKTCDI
jgi:hypothetical protein